MRSLVSPVPELFRDVAKERIAGRISKIALDEKADNITLDHIMKGYIIATPKRDHKFMKKKLDDMEIDYSPYEDLFQYADDEKQKFSIFEQTEKISSRSPFSSYRVVRTSTMENSSPMTVASMISKGVSLKYGNMYISAPVDIMTGGMMIFAMVRGRFAAFCLTKTAAMPMNTAMMDAAANSMLSMVMIRTPGSRRRTAAAI